MQPTEPGQRLREMGFPDLGLFRAVGGGEKQVCRSQGRAGTQMRPEEPIPPRCREEPMPRDTDLMPGDFKATADGAGRPASGSAPSLGAAVVPRVSWMDPQRTSFQYLVPREWTAWW